MIRVDRTVVPPPLVLTDATSAGRTETGRAIDFFMNGKGKAPKFAAYKLRVVKQALEQVFQIKCAYCESSYQAVMPFPVEHWRPKSRITLDDGSKLKKGYYWLAASWDNLLVSCSDCNGAREHVELPARISRQLGKLDRFPLADESKRASFPGAEQHEAPLLLNPCCDEPSEHMEFFDPDGERAILRPKGDSQKGERSIDIYGLNRIGLVRERQGLVGQILLHRTRVDRDLTILNQQPSPVIEAAVLENIKQTLAELVRMRSSKSPYSALARQEIDHFLLPLLDRFGLQPLP